jgi:hypothetical protein
MPLGGAYVPIGKVRTRISYPIVLLLFAASSPPAARSTLSVCASGCTFNNLQSALNAAESGDTIVLAAGETYVGDWELPATQHFSPVKVTSSASCPDRRIGPQDLHLLPILQAKSTDMPALSGWGAKGWEFECVRFEPSGNGAHNVIQLVNVPLGGGSFRNTDNIVFDRIYVAPPYENVRKGIHADGGNLTVTRSYIGNIGQPWVETKAFAMQEGPGPVTLTDNYLEAASINILFGGGDTSSSAHVPNNILIENNHLAKRPEWRDGQYQVKNLIELKAATNVRVRGNLLESGWFGVGDVALMIQPVNDTANSPWNRIADVLFDGNIVRGVSRGIVILGYEWQGCCNSGQTARITLIDNLFVTTSRFLYASGEIDDVTIDHNTIDNNSGDIWEAAGYIEAGDISTPTEQRAGLYGIDHFVFTNNLMKKGPYGWLTLNHAIGQVVWMLEKSTQSYVWFNNVVAGAAGEIYPNCGGAFDCFPSVAEHNAQFNADYTLVAGSRYRGAASDGTDLGWRPAGQSGGSSGGSGGGNPGGDGGGEDGSGGTKAPFGGTPTALPGVLQAEDFDKGGQGVSYLDADGGNNGGAYRTAEDVDIAWTGDAGGGHVVGWASAGEWLNYSVNVTAAGTYDITIRVAQEGAGGSFHIESNGADITGPLTVPMTGGWDTWTTVRKSGVWLNAGPQTWRLVLDTNGHAGATGNFNWIAVSPPSAASLPFAGVTAHLPGILDVENFDRGGQGAAYLDSDGGNNGWEYRSAEDVDIGSTSDVGGGYVVGWAGAGEWLKYSVNVSATGSYDIGVRVAHEGDGGTFHIEVNGIDVTGPVRVPLTGGWDSWATVTIPGIWLNSGEQVWRLVMDANGYAGATGNFNWISVTPR